MREIARKVYSADPSMSLGEIARAIGISCNRVKEHISDLMAAYESQRDVKLLKLELLGMPRERNEARTGVAEATIRSYFADLHQGADLRNGNGDKQGRIAQMIDAVRADLKRGYPGALYNPEGQLVSYLNS